MAVSIIVGMVSCRASCLSGAGLAEARSIDRSKVRLMWMSSMLAKS